jgi:4-hydroxy-3-methylbut-2-enyl diphosphate reductase
VPEELVAAVLDKLAGHGFGDVEEVEAVEEHMTFALPRELRAARPAGPASTAGTAEPAGPAGAAGPGSRQPG